MLKASINLSRYSEAIIYTNIVRNMREINDSINDILLENIDKETTTNISLLTTPVKDTPSVSKASTISKPENYNEETKIQLKQGILGKKAAS